MYRNTAREDKAGRVQCVTLTRGHVILVRVHVLTCQGYTLCTSRGVDVVHVEVQRCSGMRDGLKDAAPYIKDAAPYIEIFA